MANLIPGNYNVRIAAITTPWSQLCRIKCNIDACARIPTCHSRVKSCLALSKTVLVYIFISSGIINIILQRQIKTILLLFIYITYFSYVTFSYKNRFVHGMLLSGESNLQCLQGQTGALANMVRRIISTINFRLGHQLASSQTRSAGGCLPQRQTFHAAYPITFPRQCTSCLLSNCTSHRNLGLFLHTQSLLSPVERFLTCSKSQAAIKQQHGCSFYVIYSPCVCGKEMRTGCV